MTKRDRRDTFIRDQDPGQTTTTTREARRRCRPGRSAGSARGLRVKSSEPRSARRRSPSPRRDLGEDAQVAQHAAGQLRAAQVDLVVRHPDELEDLLSAGDEARAQHAVHAEGLGRRGGRRSKVVRCVGKLLTQLNESVAVVGLQTVNYACKCTCACMS